jgi:7-carboxy-7-deazaguanine synthase
MSAARVSEVFASVEGEGLYAGRPAVFLRLSGCNLSCTYCDTAYAREHTPVAVIHLGEESIEVPNPIESAELVALAKARFSGVTTVVVTGGEPLLQTDPLREIASGLRMLGYGVHLETNGTLPEALAGVVDLLDFISMDVKLPSAQGGRCLWDEHAEFLTVLRGHRAAVKIVVTADVGPSEVMRAADLIADTNPYVPTFIQSAYDGLVPAVDSRSLLTYCAMAGRKIRDVRISVQLHKILGIR